MADIFVIDDDAASELLADNLAYRGHKATRVHSIKEALDKIEIISRSDLVVLDLVMPLGDESASQTDGPRSSGMNVYRRLREKSQSLPIIVYTANQDSGIADVLRSDSAATYVPRWSGPSLSEFVGIVNEKLGIENVKPVPQVFIVHGHDDTAKYALKNYLQNTLRLPEPIILHEQPNQGRTIIEKFEDLSSRADLVFVLLTPDDPARASSATDPDKRRARQNVIFELGYFLGVLGRRSGRVFLLHKGNLDLPSDIGGLIYLSIDSGIEAVGEQIRRELNTVPLIKR